MRRDTVEGFFTEFRSSPLGLAVICVMLCVAVYVKDKSSLGKAVGLCLIMWGCVMGAYCFSYVSWPLLDRLFLAGYYGAEQSRQLHFVATNLQLVVSNGDVLPQSCHFWYRGLFPGLFLLDVFLGCTLFWALDRKFLSGWAFRPLEEELWRPFRPIFGADPQADGTEPEGEKTDSQSAPSPDS